MKKVNILCFDLSTNCYGRAYVLAELLGDSFEVEIIGHSSTEEVWGPCVAFGSRKKPTRLKGYFVTGIFVNFISNLKRIDGDIVVICKPLLSNMLYGLVLSLFTNKKIVLDIDDDEIGLYRETGFLARHIKAIVKLISPRSYYWTLLSSLFVPIFKSRIVASRELQKKYGGLLVYHARKPEILTDGEGCCEVHKEIFSRLAGKKTILFLGTPRPHKGIDVISRAVRHLSRDDLHMIVVGCANPEKVKSRLTKNISEENLTCVGIIPFKHIGCFMSKVDIVAIPQQSSSGGAKQTPAKLFDAMCFGKAILTTAVADIPDIIGTAGIVVSEPSDYKAMAEELLRLLDDDLRCSFERKTSKRFAEKFSFEKFSESLSNFINGI